MKTTSRPGSSAPTGVRFTPEDRKILKALKAKLGLGTAQILRLAIRKLAENEQVDRSEVEKAKPVWKIVAELGRQIPDEVWASVPTDLSKNLDHYLYRSPKDED